MNCNYYTQITHFLWFTRYEITIGFWTNFVARETFTFSTWSTRKYGEMVRVLQLLGCKAGN